MKRTVLLSMIAGTAALTALPSGAQTPTPIRKQFGAMTAAKMASIPDFVLPAKYKDRTAYPLPASVNLSANPFMPAYSGWSIQGWSCANATAAHVYGFEVARVLNQPASGNRPAYTYNYTYHFLNSANQAEGGDGWMFVEAFDIYKETGGATTTDFGGFDWGNGFGGWMTGYDKYYRAMKVRLDQYYKIDASLAANDELIKQYLVDQGEGSPVGGLLTFQANSGNWSTSTIAGKRTFTKLGGGGGHALNIVGYDNAHDGGSYICVNNWGDGIYYAPYRLFRAGVSGGLANAQGTPVMFCKVKKNYNPQLTFKITLTHSSRNQIALMTGVAPSASATSPTKTKDYAGAFNYSGGAVPLGGRGMTSTIEIGLDLTDFAPQITGKEARFFLHVLSKGGTGQINSVTLMDYTSGTAKEIAGTEPGKAIGTGTTTVSIPWNGTLSTAIKAPAKTLAPSAKRLAGRGHDAQGRRLGNSPAAGIAVFK